MVGGQTRFILAIPIVKNLKLKNMSTNREEYWTKKAEAILLNKKIVGVRYLTKQEEEMLGWNYRCVVMELEDGTLVYPSKDDEGNDAGALFYQSSDKENDDYVLPVISE